MPTSMTAKVASVKAPLTTAASLMKAQAVALGLSPKLKSVTINPNGTYTVTAFLVSDRFATYTGTGATLTLAVQNCLATVPAPK
jgi:hypothetical protein